MTGLLSGWCLDVQSPAPVAGLAGGSRSPVLLLPEFRDYPVRVRVRISEEAVEVVLSRWEKILGLLGNIRVPLADVGDVEVVAEPMRAAMRSGLKVGG
jgi:hypothetical protein